MLFAELTLPESALDIALLQVDNDDQVDHSREVSAGQDVQYKIDQVDDQCCHPGPGFETPESPANNQGNNTKQ